MKALVQSFVITIFTTILVGTTMAHYYHKKDLTRIPPTQVQQDSNLFFTTLDYMNKDNFRYRLSLFSIATWSLFFLILYVFLPNENSQNSYDYLTHVYPQHNNTDIPNPLTERRIGKPPAMSKSSMPPVPSEDSHPDPNNNWYVVGPNKDIFGPYTLEQLRESVSVGDISHTTYVWKKGLENWIHLFEISEFDRRKNKRSA